MPDGGRRWMWLRDARGRRHRSGQGLRRGILLGLRETAKSIAAGPELACGSDSRPCRNNAVSRSPSSNHPSSAAARPDATFLWLTLPTDRKKTCGGWKRTGRPVLKCQTGTEYSYKYRRIQKQDQPNHQSHCLCSILLFQTDRQPNKDLRYQTAQSFHLQHIYNQHAPVSPNNTD